MTAEQYRAEAERLRDAAEKRWTAREAREWLLDLARAYELLAKTAPETLINPEKLLSSSKQR